MAFFKSLLPKSKGDRRASATSALLENIELAVSRRKILNKAAAKVDGDLLAYIFSFVAPSALDEGYATCDESLEDGCSVCETADLNSCSQVCRAWSRVATDQLYKHIRLDAVHFCGIEAKHDMSMSKKHKKGTGNRETADHRLQLLSRTLNAAVVGLPSKVQSLKITYMTRESCIADLARAVSRLSKLRYVDLPDGFFSNDLSCMKLRQNIEESCKELRVMKFTHGSERPFSIMARNMVWHELEVLVLKDVNVTQEVLLYTLASLPRLEEVQLGGKMPALDDDLFTPSSAAAVFPALKRLVLADAPAVTAKGLCAFFSKAKQQEMLESLTLKDTGVLLHEIHQVILDARNLIKLVVEATVDHPWLQMHIPLLCSPTLETIKWCILPKAITSETAVSESYYEYIFLTMEHHGLPKLRALYAYSESLPQRLRNASEDESDSVIVSLNNNEVGGDSHVCNADVSGSGTSGVQSLTFDLYTKLPATPEMDWVLTAIRAEGFKPAPRDVHTPRGCPRDRPDYAELVNDLKAGRLPKGIATPVTPTQAQGRPNSNRAHLTTASRLPKGTAAQVPPSRAQGKPDSNRTPQTMPRIVHEPDGTGIPQSDLSHPSILSTGRVAVNALEDDRHGSGAEASAERSRPKFHRPGTPLGFPAADKGKNVPSHGKSESYHSNDARSIRTASSQAIPSRPRPKYALPQPVYGQATGRLSASVEADDRMKGKGKDKARGMK